MTKNIPNEFKKWKVQFKIELLIAILILATPFLIYAHLAFSKTLIGIDIFWWEWKHGFKNNQLFAWNFLSDFSPLCLLIIAYSTINYRYRNFITPFIILFFFFTISDIFYLSPIYYFTKFEGLYLAALILMALRFLDKYIVNGLRRNLLTFNSKDLIREFLVLKNSKIIRNVEKTARKSNEVSSIQYLCRLHFYTELMQNAIDKSIKNANTGFSRTNRYPYIQIILICALTLNFTYLIIPKDLKSIEFIGIVIHDLGFGTISDLVWYIFKKLSLLIVFFIWFVTSNNWWRLAILSPILIYSYQLVEIFYDINELESYGNSNIFPAVIFILLFILLISRTVKLRTKMMDYLELFRSEMTKEISRLSKSI